MTKKKQSFTCIALIKNRRGKLIMAGDRRITDSDGTGFTSPVPKIIKKRNGILLGGCGDADVLDVIISGFTPPNISKEISTFNYMLFNFLPTLRNFLMNQYDWINAEKLLCVPLGIDSSFLVGINGEAFEIIISSEETEEIQRHRRGTIKIERAPIPFAIGCGASAAYPILQTEYKALKYNTREQLINALTIAADINSGCDNNIDIISED